MTGLLDDKAAEVRAALAAGDVSRAAAALNAYVAEVANSTCDRETAVRLQTEWDELRSEVRTAAVGLREDARVRLGRLHQVTAFRTPAAHAPNILEIKG